MDYVADEKGYRPMSGKGYLFTPRITHEGTPEPEAVLEVIDKDSLISSIK